MERINIAIFVSGSGTNCENLIRYFEGSETVNCALVVSNKADAPALEKATRLGVPTAITPKADLNNSDVMLPLLSGRAVAPASGLSASVRLNGSVSVFQ